LILLWFDVVKANWWCVEKLVKRPCTAAPTPLRHFCNPLHRLVQWGCNLCQLHEAHDSPCDWPPRFHVESNGCSWKGIP
jgi:hypothetical protein